MTDKQFKALVDLQMLGIEMKLSMDAKMMTILKTCSIILETQNAGSGAFSDKWIADFTKNNFDQNYTLLEQHYQPEIDRIMGELRD